MLLLCFVLIGSLILPDWWLLHLTRQSHEWQQQTENLYIYGGLVAAALILSIMRAAAFFNAAINSSKHLHTSMLSAVLRAPILFFDTNPIGRILNRFSRDIGIMDELLPEIFLEAVQIVLFCIGAVVLPSILNPWIILPATPLIIIFILIGRYYLTTARDVRRLEGISRSPVLSHFSDSLMGLVTIRAYKREDAFLETLYRLDLIFFAFVKHMHFVCALVSGSCDPDLSTGRGNCVVFFGKILYIIDTEISSRKKDYVKMIRKMD